MTGTPNRLGAGLRARLPAWPARLSARLASVAAAALLAGCAAAPAAPDAADDASRVTTWRGRFALTATFADPDATPGTAPRQESALGAFVLRRVRAAPRDTHAIELYSPLGQTVATARIDAGGARIELADGRRFEAADADALAEQTFGWRLPLARLADWLDGQAGSAAERDVTGRLLRAVDSNWLLTVTGWDDKQPTRLDLSWPVEPVVPPRTIRLRLAIEP